MESSIIKKEEARIGKIHLYNVEQSCITTIDNNFKEAFKQGRVS